jgi:hypothetical protein
MTNFDTILLLGAQTRVPLGVTILFGCLLVALILCLALEEKLHAKPAELSTSVGSGRSTTATLPETAARASSGSPVLVNFEFGDCWAVEYVNVAVGAAGLKLVGRFHRDLRAEDVEIDEFGESRQHDQRGVRHLRVVQS